MNISTLKHILSVIKQHTGASGEISIKWCNDKAMQEINYQFRGLNKPTNVLSFPSELPDYLGDIAISLETIEREANEQQKKYDDHLTHMVVHGVLHLLGYDHEDDTDAKEMEALEVKILGALGISAPY